jgi:hypothetical protein
MKFDAITRLFKPTKAKDISEARICSGYLPQQVEESVGF